jgi:hypothetical protein
MLNRAAFVGLTATFVAGAVLLVLIVAGAGIVDPLLPLFGR